MIRFCLCLLLCGAIAAADVVSTKPTLYVVHATWCAPCRNFDNAWETDADFRGALLDAYTVRSLDWDKPDERAFALRLGIINPCTGKPGLPTYVGIRANGRKQISFGFAFTLAADDVRNAKADLMRDLGIEWPRARPPAAAEVSQPPAVPERRPPVVSPDPVPPKEVVDIVARDGVTKLIAQSRELHESQLQSREAIGRLSAEIGDVRDAFDSSHDSLSKKIDSSRVDVSSLSASLRETVERLIIERTPVPALPPVVDAVVDSVLPPSDSVDSVDSSPAGSGISGKWLSVLATAAKVGIAVAAPEIALPLSGGLTAAGLALSWIRRRRAARQPGPLGSESNPISVQDRGTVRTDTKFVVTESDVLGEAYAEAIRRCANQHRESKPGVVDALQQVEGVARQIAHGQRVVRRPSKTNAPETLP
jgi:hypothetical protein